MLSILFASSFVFAKKDNISFKRSIWASPGEYYSFRGKRYCVRDAAIVFDGATEADMVARIGTAYCKAKHCTSIKKCFSAESKELDDFNEALASGKVELEAIGAFKERKGPARYDPVYWMRACARANGFDVDGGGEAAPPQPSRGGRSQEASFKKSGGNI